MSKAGALLYQLRCDRGFRRGRQNFLNKFGIKWGPERLRNYETGRTAMSEEDVDEPECANDIETTGGEV